MFCHIEWFAMSMVFARRCIILDIKWSNLATNISRHAEDNVAFAARPISDTFKCYSIDGNLPRLMLRAWRNVFALSSPNDRYRPLCCVCHSRLVTRFNVTGSFSLCDLLAGVSLTKSYIWKVEETSINQLLQGCCNKMNKKCLHSSVE